MLQVADGPSAAAHGHHHRQRLLSWLVPAGEVAAATGTLSVCLSVCCGAVPLAHAPDFVVLLPPYPTGVAQRFRPHGPGTPNRCCLHMQRKAVTTGAAPPLGAAPCTPSRLGQGPHALAPAPGAAVVHLDLGNQSQSQTLGLLGLTNEQPAPGHGTVCTRAGQQQQ